MAGELTPLYIDGACASALAARYLQGQMICQPGVGGDWYDPDDSFQIRVDPTNAARVIANRGVAFVRENRPSEIPAYYFVASEEEVTGTYSGQIAGERDIYMVVQDSNEQGTVNGWMLAFFPTNWANPTDLPVLKLARITGNGQVLDAATLTDERVQFLTCTTGPPNELTIGEVETLPWDSPATAEITGRPPSQVLDLGIPVGEPNELRIGTVTSGDTAGATITGTPPDQTLSLVLPRGERGPVGPKGPAEAGHWQRVVAYGKAVLGAAADLVSNPGGTAPFTVLLRSTDITDDGQLYRLIVSGCHAGGPAGYAGLVADATAYFGYRYSTPYSGSAAPPLIDIEFCGADAKAWQGGTSYAVGITGVWEGTQSYVLVSFPNYNGGSSNQFIRLETPGSYSTHSRLFPQSATSSSARYFWNSADIYHAAAGSVSDGGLKNGLRAIPPWQSFVYYPPVGVMPFREAHTATVGNTGKYHYASAPFGISSTGYDHNRPRQVCPFPDAVNPDGIRGAFPPSIIDTNPSSAYVDGTGAGALVQGDQPFPPQVALYKWTPA